MRTRGTNKVRYYINKGFKATELWIKAILYWGVRQLVTMKRDFKMSVLIVKTAYEENN